MSGDPVSQVFYFYSVKVRFGDIHSDDTSTSFNCLRVRVLLSPIMMCQKGKPYP
jgi:hypothetical protein